jgi:hypothetical protein
VRSSAGAKEIATRPVAPVDDKQVDVWFSFLPSDIVFARAIAEALNAFGYTSAPHDVLNHADEPALRLKPRDARYVIALWTPPAIGDRQIQADARTAGHDGRLIEVAFRKACPSERFSDDALISFKRTENIMHTEQWRELLTRLRPLCGAPRRKLPEVMRYVPALSIALALAGGGTAAMQMADNSHEVGQTRIGWRPRSKRRSRSFARS